MVRVVHGLVPLSGDRRGEDVMLTDALGFDLRVYDPGAPLFGHSVTETVLEPTDPAWTTAYLHSDNMHTSVASSIGKNNASANVDVSVRRPRGVRGSGLRLRRSAARRAIRLSLPTPQFAAGLLFGDHALVLSRPGH